MMGMLILISSIVIFTLISVVEVNARLNDIIKRLEKMKGSLENMKKGEQK